MDHGSTVVSVGEGVYEDSGWVIREPHNWVDIKVHRFTGRIDVEHLEDWENL